MTNEHDKPENGTAVGGRLERLVMRQTGWIGRADYAEMKRVINAPYPKHGEDKTIMPTLYKTKGKREHWSECDWPPLKITITVDAA